jgi:hypothetical protein
VQIKLLDDRPLVLEIITALIHWAGRTWWDEDTNTWNMEAYFTPVSCWLGRPYARFYLKELVPIDQRWRPQDAVTYGVVELETNCIALPEVSK